jgi:hypothetical protein
MISRYIISEANSIDAYLVTIYMDCILAITIKIFFVVS